MYVYCIWWTYILFDINVVKIITGITAFPWQKHVKYLYKYWLMFNENDEFIILWVTDNKLVL